jgi:acetyl esterase/lipase
MTYVNTDPPLDAGNVIDHVRANAASIGIDGQRLGLWSCSGSVPTALALLMQPQRAYLKCAVMLYGCMLDWDGSTIVADQSKAFGFANPTAGKSVTDLSPDVPLFLARAGRDEMPRLNEALDRFIADAIARNLPITVANHHRSPHAFDAVDDSDASRAAIADILSFLRRRLLTHTHTIK